MTAPSLSVGSGGRRQTYAATCAPVPGRPSQDMGRELGVCVCGCLCVYEWEGWGRVGICLIPLSAGSSDRQLLPHLLPCWMGAWWLSAAHLPQSHLFFFSLSFSLSPSKTLFFIHPHRTHSAHLLTLCTPGQLPRSAPLRSSPVPALRCALRKWYSRSCHGVPMHNTKKVFRYDCIPPLLCQMYLFKRNWPKDKALYTD